MAVFYTVHIKFAVINLVVSFFLLDYVYRKLFIVYDQIFSWRKSFVAGFGTIIKKNSSLSVIFKVCFALWRC